MAQASADEVVNSALKGFIESGNYSWTAVTELKGGPAAGVSEISGRFDTSEGWFVETEIEGSTLRAAGRGNAKVLSLGSGWIGFHEFSGKEEMDRRARELVMMARPHEELRMLSGAVEPLQPTAEGEFKAILGPEVARSFLLFVVSQRAPANAERALKSVTGDLRVWIKGEQLVRYRVFLQASFSLGLLKRSVERTVTVEIRDLGQTEVTFPAGVEAALQSRPE